MSNHKVNRGLENAMLHGQVSCGFASTGCRNVSNILLDV